MRKLTEQECAQVPGRVLRVFQSPVEMDAWFASADWISSRVKVCYDLPDEYVVYMEIVNG